MSVRPDSPPIETPPGTQEVLVIEAGRANVNYWRDLWNYRDLFRFLTLRDIKIRYKQTYLGIAWAIVQPVVTTGIFTFVFGKLAGMQSGGVPYPLLVLSGMLPWQLFSASLMGSSASLISNSHLISKVYFPRLIIPISSLGVALIDFFVVMALYVVVSIWFGRYPSWHWTILPLFIFATLFLAFGMGLWFTALTVKYRDFKYIVPFIAQVGIFLSPIGYSTGVVPTWSHLLDLNPLTGLIDGFRWCLLTDGHPFYLHGIICSTVISVILTASGLWYFRKMERTFADVI
jgi:lipopolysaccharide transport system permease protein